jgi:cellulose biosynthesis protein BcsQ
MSEKYVLSVAAPDLSRFLRDWEVAATDERFVLVSITNNWAHTLESLATQEPDVLLVSADLAPNDQELLKALAHLKQAIAIVLLPNAWEAARGALEQAHSVRKVYSLPAAPAEVMNFAFSAVNTERARLSSTAPLQPLGVARERAIGTRVIALVSASGGSGKSTIAEGLAAELAKRRAIRSLLFSFNHPAPSVLRHKLRRAPSAEEFFSRPEAGFPDALQTSAEGFDVVLAPQDPVDYAQAAQVAADQANSIKNLVIRAYTGDYAAILLDLPSGESEWTLQPLLAANKVLIVARPCLDQLHAVAHTANLITQRLAGQHQIDRQAVFTVLNFRHKGSAFTPNTFAAEGAQYSAKPGPMHMGGWFPPVLASFEQDEQVTRAQDQQRPVADLSESFARSIQVLADAFFEPGGNGMARPGGQLRRILPGLSIRVRG